MPIHWKPFLAPSTLALKFAIKTLLAGGLALWCAFRFDLEQPQWALMTVLIVSQPLSGMVVAKGLFRLLGTLVGTAMSVLMIALFAQAPWLFLLAISLWLGLCTAASTSLRNHVSYAFVLSGYTVAIIGLPAVDQPLLVFEQAVARCTEICLGIICASAVSAILWPQRVEQNLDKQAHATWLLGMQAARGLHAQQPGGVGLLVEVLLDPLRPEDRTDRRGADDPQADLGTTRHRLLEDQQRLVHRRQANDRHRIAGKYESIGNVVAQGGRGRRAEPQPERDGQQEQPGRLGEQRDHQHRHRGADQGAEQAEQALRHHHAGQRLGHDQHGHQRPLRLL